MKLSIFVSSTSPAAPVDSSSKRVYNQIQQQFQVKCVINSSGQKPNVTRITSIVRAISSDSYTDIRITNIKIAVKKFGSKTWSLTICKSDSVSERQRKLCWDYLYAIKSEIRRSIEELCHRHSSMCCKTKVAMHGHIARRTNKRWGPKGAHLLHPEISGLTRIIASFSALQSKYSITLCRNYCFTSQYLRHCSGSGTHTSGLTK